MLELSDFEQGLKFFYDNDYPNAARCFINAAALGNAEAQFSLGNMYAEGHGIPQDDQQSLALFRKAAEQGFAPAQVNLGVMYTQGQGVERNLVEAHKWFNIAGGAVNEEGIDLREVVEEQMTPDEISEAMRLAKDWITAYHRRYLG
jgi:TPR repeat protein